MCYQVHPAAAAATVILRRWDPRPVPASRPPASTARSGPWLAVASRPFGSGHAGRGRLGAGELEQWLCGPEVPAPTIDDLAAAFGPAIHAVSPRAPLALARELRFTLAVLRDVFADDDGVHRWLHCAPGGDPRPIDLLLSGRLAELEAVAVREWNDSALSTVGG